MSTPAPLDVVRDALRQRRTVNFFTDQRVDPALVAEAVRVARWAPNHRLTEPWQFFHLGPEYRGRVIDLAVALARREKGDEAAAARRDRLEAVPEWLVVTARRSDDPLLDREDYAATCCAAQNMMLFLSAAGVGSKWTTGAVTREPALLDLLGLSSDTHRVVGLFWLGYPRQPAQSRRAPLHDVFQTTA